MINILAQNVDFIISGTVCNNLAVYKTRHWCMKG